MTEANPFFSIIVPVYDRESLIGRALRSCLAQSLTDFEIVVVDDGSADRSADAVRAFDDPRIRLIVHDRNRGRCPARNTAMAAARGEWLVFLDSDDELLADALQIIHRDAAAAHPAVAMLRYACVDELGAISPNPPYPREAWGYERFLRWIEDSGNGPSESLPCSRASTFPEIAYPGGHAEEILYHLDLARRWAVGVSPQIVRRYHHDAPNQITRPNLRRALRFAADAARNVDVVLERHGEGLHRHAPATYARRLREGALYHFMAGNRAAGLRYARRYLQASGPSVKLALILAFGMAGRVPLVVSQIIQATLRRALAGPR